MNAVTPSRLHTPIARRGRVLLLLFLAVVILGLGGAAWMVFSGGGSGSGNTARDLREVRRGRFDVIIPASGELAALRQVEVVNALDARAVVTEIIPEGTMVKPGDVLFRLADDELKDKIKDAEDAVATANANVAAAESSLAVKLSSAASEKDKAELQVRLSELALDGWINGDLKSKKQQLDLAIETAEINAERLKLKFVESGKLLQEGHISKDEYERDRIEKIKAEAEVETAKLAREVYHSYQRPQEEAQKRSDVDQAKAELERVVQRNEAEINNAKVALASAQYKAKSAQERLDKLKRQLEACVARAPSGGLVVYASSLEGNRWGGRDEKPLQVGSELSPNQTVIILPDTSQMVANIKVNEALTGKIRPGQLTTVISDAHPNVPIRGEVLSVGVLAESAGWRDPNRRDYTVRVLLDAGEELGLKPSMRCRAEIIVDTVDDAIHVPIQAVFRKGPLAYVYVQNGEGYAQREVRLGRSSELEVEIVAGLDSGETVLLREPSPTEVTSKLAQPAREGPPAGKPPAREVAGGMDKGKPEPAKG